MPETMTAEIPTKQTWPSNPPNNGICKTQICRGPLTWLGPPWNNWLCLNCNTHPADVANQKTEKPERKYIDITLTEKRVREIIEESLGEDKIREIIQDELADWHIQKPPVTAGQIVSDLAEAVGVGGENVHISVQVPKPETWLQKAKRLGVPTHQETGGMRKKVDVLADITAKEGETDGRSGNSQDSS